MLNGNRVKSMILAAIVIIAMGFILQISIGRANAGESQ